MIPSAQLLIECAAVNPPKPVGCGVFVDGKIVATLTIEELRETAKRLIALEAERGIVDAFRFD